MGGKWMVPRDGLPVRNSFSDLAGVRQPAIALLSKVFHGQVSHRHCSSQDRPARHSVLGRTVPRRPDSHRPVIQRDICEGVLDTSLRMRMEAFETVDSALASVTP